MCANVCELSHSEPTAAAALTADTSGDFKIAIRVEPWSKIFASSRTFVRDEAFLFFAFTANRTVYHYKKEKPTMLKITLKGGVVKEYAAGTSVADIAANLGAGLFKAACAAKINGEVCDLRTPVIADCEVEILTFDDPEGKKAFWHTGSHILAQAVKRLYPAAKLAMGPAVENGFFYDIDIEPAFGGEDLEKIEAEMKKIVSEGHKIERFELDVPEALELMKDDPYKIELINEHAGAGEKISFYRQGEFTDLCAGPHLPDVSRLKAIKLTQCTGAYWRADAANKMLCRVYGTAFPKASELEAYLTMMEEAKKRDHRKLGRELELFDIFEDGPGFPVFFPKGMILRNELEAFWRRVHKENGYVEIRTPQIMNHRLWKTSKHWYTYKENMYLTEIDEEDYVIKPMNCPGGMLVYKNKPHSYRELPMRVGELGIVHRHELSGALHGLMRVRCFTQDDAHLYIADEDVTDEIVGVINKIDRMYGTFGFEYHLELSTKPSNAIGTDEEWDIATDWLRKALDQVGRPYRINEGDGAFYGPKIDFHLKDSIGRTWQCGTIQLDLQQPINFDLTYTDKNGEKRRPVMIHTTSYGSLERFMGILTEHFMGAFPLWIAPVQVKILPVSEKHIEFAEKIAEKLDQAGIRVEIDDRSEKIGYKIRGAQLEKVPYMLVVGDKEAADGTVALRSRSKGDLGTVELDKFIADALEEIKTKAL